VARHPPTPPSLSLAVEGLERFATSQDVVIVRVCVWAQTRDGLV
jgi:hypothetical protein